MKKSLAYCLLALGGVVALLLSQSPRLASLSADRVESPAHAEHKDSKSAVPQNPKSTASSAGSVQKSEAAAVSPTDKDDSELTAAQHNLPQMALQLKFAAFDLNKVLASLNAHGIELQPTSELDGMGNRRVLYSQSNVRPDVMNLELQVINGANGQTELEGSRYSLPMSKKIFTKTLDIFTADQSLERHVVTREALTFLTPEGASLWMRTLTNGLQVGLEPVAE
jgi:hypothetical protein